MSSWDVDLNELLKFQKKFILHAINIKMFATELNKNLDEIGVLLQDEISQRTLKRIKELVNIIQDIGNHAVIEMERYEKKTEKQIEYFQSL